MRRIPIQGFRKAIGLPVGTLQELLMPCTLNFYSKDSYLLGERTSLNKVVEKCAGINLSELDRELQIYTGLPSLHQFSIAKRISWAALRKTTRKEDIAYCLMGLFDVNMPLMYGEGGSKASLRLQHAIMQTTSDQSLLA